MGCALALGTTACLAFVELPQVSQLDTRPSTRSLAAGMPTTASASAAFCHFRALLHHALTPQRKDRDTNHVSRGITEIAIGRALYTRSLSVVAQNSLSFLSSSKVAPTRPFVLFSVEMANYFRKDWSDEANGVSLPMALLQLQCRGSVD